MTNLSTTLIEPGNKTRKQFTFIDLCAGCGGLSLGLMKAGWNGLFAIEKDEMAFSTLSHNLIEKDNNKFQWPPWLPKKAISLEKLLADHEEELLGLRGKLTLLAGGPPCQGFSTIGRRLAHDPRNQVFKHYLKLVKLTQPKMVLMENVRGILYAFDSTEDGNDKETSKKKNSPIYAELVKTALENELEYKVWYSVIHSKDFGVPQTRPRFILVGIKKSEYDEKSGIEPFKLLQQLRSSFLLDKKLDQEPIGVEAAIGDLTKKGNRLEQCVEMKRFEQGAYGKQCSNYQKLMHGSLNGALADSHRFARHFDRTVTKFQWFQDNCYRGKKLEQEDRGEFKNNKHTIYILDPNKPAPTVTTLPDDLLHYSEPRILTVREMARLQSFPDSFEFKGKYTTGGQMRTKECPRYTQVGNAVPPLLAEALGRSLEQMLAELKKR